MNGAIGGRAIISGRGPADCRIVEADAVAGETVRRYPMRFMLLMLPAGYESAGPELDLPVDRVEAMMAYNQALQDAGVLQAL